MVGEGRDCTISKWYTQCERGLKGYRSILGALQGPLKDKDWLWDLMEVRSSVPRVPWNVFCCIV